jgi:uncharacterized coiled-coil protein SlyX
MGECENKVDCCTGEVKMPSTIGITPELIANMALTMVKQESRITELTSIISTTAGEVSKVIAQYNANMQKMWEKVMALEASFSKLDATLTTWVSQKAESTNGISASIVNASERFASKPSETN